MLAFQLATIHDVTGMPEEPEDAPLDQDDSMGSGMCTHNQPSNAGSKSTIQECEHGPRAAIIPDDLKKLSDTLELLVLQTLYPAATTPDTDDVTSPGL